MKIPDILTEWKNTYPAAAKVLKDKYVILDRNNICMVDFDENLDALIERGLKLSPPHNYLIGLVSDEVMPFCFPVIEDK